MIHKLLLFDTETTGINHARCIQLAYKRIDASTMKEEAEKHVMIKPPIPIEIGAMAVHHITEDAVKDCPTFSEILAPVQALVNTCCLVAHNAAFDIQTFKNEGVNVDDVVHICTYKLAVHLYPDFENHKLQYLRYALGVDKPEFHTMQTHDARTDVLVLEAVFNQLLWDFIEKKYDKKEYDENVVLEMLELMAKISKDPILYPKIRFGKYRGKTFDELRLRDKKYLEWLLDNETRKPLGEQDENLTFTIRHYLQ